MDRPDGGTELVDLSSIVDDITPEALASSVLALITGRVASGELATLPEGQRVGAPLARIGKIVCVGLNYREHAAEAGLPIPDEPILFMKAPDTVVGPDDDVRVPRGSVKTDYEVELAVVIGRTTRYLDPDDNPLDYVAGYAISNDVSEREFQMERGGQWDKGKNCETFNPLGPWIVTADEVGDPQVLTLSSRVNGEMRQNSSTADMIFPVAEIVRYISQFMTLYPGDVINTGTPQGVGAGFDPPRFVCAGDVVEVMIERLGTQRQRFVVGVGAHS
ncbi:MAG: fumarylacetoacetate hydrolase family protein [Salinibacterium sp.]|nr:fumarylacetoacetate hydrolase family protein [Salinibacterium sp.]